MNTPSQEIEGLVHWHDAQYLVRSRGTLLEVSRDNGQSFRRLLRIPLRFPKNLCSYSKLGCRLLRTNIKHCLRLENQNWLVFCGKNIFVIDGNSGRILSVSKIHGSRPLRVCQTAENIFYGEYRSNPHREPIKLWRSSDHGMTWQSAFTFNNIRHIHGVFRDPLDHSIWVTTGDNDNESAIYRASNEHSLDFQPVLGGSQQTRVIDVLFGSDHNYFGSDAPDEKNWLYRSRRNGTELEQLQAVGGTVFHAMEVGGRFYFSTAREPSEVNARDQVELWQSTSDWTFEKVWQDEKDRWSMKYFQYGQILFPAGPGAENGFWVSSFATINDQKSFLFEVPIRDRTKT